MSEHERCLRAVMLGCERVASPPVMQAGVMEK